MHFEIEHPAPKAWNLSCAHPWRLCMQICMLSHSLAWPHLWSRMELNSYDLKPNFECARLICSSFVYCWTKVKCRWDDNAGLKVNKSQKQFLDWSILPKNKGKTWNNYPKSSQDIVFLCFVRFLGRIENSNFFFWDLLTFRS